MSDPKIDPAAIEASYQRVKPALDRLAAHDRGEIDIEVPDLKVLEAYRRGYAAGKEEAWGKAHEAVVENNCMNEEEFGADYMTDCDRALRAAAREDGVELG